MPLGQPLSLGFQISYFLAKLYINIYHIKIKTFPSVVSEEKSGQNLSGFRHARGQALVSDNLNCETLLHSFTFISSIFPNFRIGHPLVS